MRASTISKPVLIGPMGTHGISDKSELLLDLQHTGVHQVA